MGAAKVRLEKDKKIEAAETTAQKKLREELKAARGLHAKKVAKERKAAIVHSWKEAGVLAASRKYAKQKKAVKMAKQAEKDARTLMGYAIRRAKNEHTRKVVKALGAEKSARKQVQILQTEYKFMQKQHRSAKSVLAEAQKRMKDLGPKAAAADKALEKLKRRLDSANDKLDAKAEMQEKVNGKLAKARAKMKQAAARRVKADSRLAESQLKAQYAKKAEVEAGEKLERLDLERRTVSGAVSGAKEKAKNLLGRAIGHAKASVLTRDNLQKSGFPFVGLNPKQN